MSLAHRIIPTILCRGRQAVKGTGFNSWRPIGTVAEKVRIHAARGVDELVLLDVTATLEGRGPNLAMVEYLTDTLFAPLAVGGGIRSLQDVRQLLRAGADKVVLGSTAVRDPELVMEVASVVGSQALVVSVDVHSGRICSESGRRRWDFAAVEWCVAMERNGAGEILLQSVERDGTMTGYDLQLIDQVSRAVGIPVIASGGAGTYAHMAEALLAGASAVAAGAMFQFTEATPKEAAQYLAKEGIEVRL